MKRTFEIFDEMNLADVENGTRTRTIAVSNTLLSAEKTKSGCMVAMGIDETALMGLMQESHVAILCIVDKADFLKRNGS